MIPVFLPGPKAFSKVEVQVVRKLPQFSPAYAKIFGAGPGRKRSLAGTRNAVATEFLRSGGLSRRADTRPQSYQACLMAQECRFGNVRLAFVRRARPRHSSWKNRKDVWENPSRR